MNTGKLARLIGRDAMVLDRSTLSLRYPREIVTRETVKSGLGLAFCLAVLLFLNPATIVAWILVVIGALFALYLYQQLTRFNLQFAMDERGLTRTLAGRRRIVQWDRMDKLRLNYYPNGRKAQNGTLVLTVYQGRNKVKVDSGLDHFPTLLNRAATHARERGLELSPTTDENLNHLGL